MLFIVCLVCLLSTFTLAAFSVFSRSFLSASSCVIGCFPSPLCFCSPQTDFSCFISLPVNQSFLISSDDVWFFSQQFIVFFFYCSLSLQWHSSSLLLGNHCILLELNVFLIVFIFPCVVNRFGNFCLSFSM